MGLEGGWGGDISKSDKAKKSHRGKIRMLPEFLDFGGASIASHSFLRQILRAGHRHGVFLFLFFLPPPFFSK